MYVGCNKVGRIIGVLLLCIRYVNDRGSEEFFLELRINYSMEMYNISRLRDSFI